MTDEKTVSVIVGQVRRLLYKKRTTNALEVLTAHLEEDPEDREAQELLGVCHFKSKQYEEAKRLGSKRADERITKVKAKLGS